MFGLGLDLMRPGAPGGIGMPAPAPWTPADAPEVIEWGAADTLRTAAGQPPAPGETVETWLSKGSLGSLTMTRAAGAPVLALSHGRPYLAVPDAGGNASIFSFAQKDLVGTEIWALIRKPDHAALRMVFCKAGGNSQVKMGLTFVIAGSPAIYGNAIKLVTPVPEATWFVIRGQFRPDGAFVEADAANRQTVTAAQGSFPVDSIGNHPAGQRCDYDIASYVTVYGTADAALEAALYAWLGAERDRLNGIA